MKKIIMFLAIFILNIQPFSFVSAESNDQLKAAFIKMMIYGLKLKIKK
jgi:hypothetical protein